MSARRSRSESRSSSKIRVTEDLSAKDSALQTSSRSCAVPLPLRPGNESDPAFKSIELVQRGRMLLDIAHADLDAAQGLLGPFHETTWHFRNTLDETKRAWDRLRAEFGTATLESALAQPPITFLVLGQETAPTAILISVAGKTYRAERVHGQELVRSLWRLTCLPLSEDGPYYVARLRDDTCYCDCAEWTYKVEQVNGAMPCKHVAGLQALGWI